MCLFLSWHLNALQASISEALENPDQPLQDWQYLIETSRRSWSLWLVCFLLTLPPSVSSYAFRWYLRLLKDEVLLAYAFCKGREWAHKCLQSVESKTTLLPQSAFSQATNMDSASDILEVGKVIACCETWFVISVARHWSCCSTNITI